MPAPSSLRTRSVPPSALALSVHARQPEAVAQGGRAESPAVVANPQPPLIAMLELDVDHARRGVLDRVGDRLATDMDQRVPRHLVRLAARRHPARVKAQLDAARGAARAGLDGLDHRLALLGAQAIDELARAGQGALSGGHDDPRLAPDGGLIGERPRGREREREILHDQVVHVGGQATAFLRERDRDRAAAGIAQPSA